MAISWVRDGILMCGMDNEISVFSQWRAQSEQKAIKGHEDEGEESESGRGGVRESSGGDIVEHRSLQETDILNLAQVRR